MCLQIDVLSYAFYVWCHDKCENHIFSILGMRNIVQWICCRYTHAFKHKHMNI